MTVLVADKFEQSGLDGLKAAGCEVVYQPDASGDALTEGVRTTGAALALAAAGTLWLVRGDPSTTPSSPSTTSGATH